MAARRDGFTFIELVFVAIILALILVSASPMFRGAWGGVQAERVAFEVAQRLRVARALAIAQGQPVAWGWDPVERSMQLRQVLEDGSSVPVPGAVGRSRYLPSDITLTVTRDHEPVEQITFAPGGTSESTLLEVGIAASPRYQIAVDEATGTVAVQPARLPPG